MQRPIKFRAWWQHPQYNEDGGMYGVAGIVWGTPDDGEPEYKLSLEPVQVALVGYPLVENYQKLGWNKQCKLMQYTGLKDKNGVEIYEGDIVLYQYREKQLSDHRQLCTVIYEPKAAAFLLAARHFEPQAKYLGDIASAGKHHDIRTYELCEVIGNIYENPELLGGTDE